MVTIKNTLHHHEKEQLDNTFIARELGAENEEVKQPQREKVADFLLANHADDLPMVCFSLPGVRWRFEHMLDARRRPELNRFVGVERNYTILEKGALWLPGNTDAKPFDESLRAGSLSGWHNDRSSVFWMRCVDFMSLGRALKGSRSRRRRWADDYSRWTAAWLDFSAPLNKEVITCLQRLESHCDYVTDEVPFALTIMLGREDRATSEAMDIAAAGRANNTLERRVALVEAILSARDCRTFYRGPCWDYTSAGGAPMGVITGRLILKEQYRLKGPRSGADPGHVPAPRMEKDEARRRFPEGSTFERAGTTYTVIGYVKNKLRVAWRDGSRMAQCLMSLEEAHGL